MNSKLNRSSPIRYSPSPNRRSQIYDQGPPMISQSHRNFNEESINMRYSPEKSIRDTNALRETNAYWKEKSGSPLRSQKYG
jgi:hypothetical protein